MLARSVANWYERLRHPVRRARGETYLLLVLVSFGATVLLTRWYLAVAGYPQIGGGELHIAHALWGGLLLFVASAMPLLLAGRAIYPVSAVLSGIGIGLFADEVGKFITAGNDYFYPAALPVIYAVFLIAVLVYLRSRRPLARDARSQLLATLEELEEAVERDLEPSELKLLEERLSGVQASARSEDQRRLALTLLTYVRSPRTHITSERHGPIERLARWWQARRERLLGRRGATWLYGATLTVTGIRAIITVAALAIGVISVISGTRTSSSTIETVQLFVEGFAGALLVPGILLIAAGRARQGLRLTSLSLALALLVQDTIGFYLNQFDAVWSALFHLVLLIGLAAYRPPVTLASPSPTP
jgi:ABC-type multidrug transport system fused ATPase/permease subunit